MRGLLLMGASSTVGALLVVFFLVLFLGLIALVYRRAARDEMVRAAQLPFDDEAK